MKGKVVIMYFLALVLVLVLAQPGARSLASQFTAPAPESYSGAALVGVDKLGRVLIALDEDPADETVDRYFRFTATERLDGPWSEIVTDATVQVIGRSLVFRGGDHLLSLAPDSLSAAPAMEGESITLEAHQGLEIHHTKKSTGRTLSEHDIGDVTTWPRGYERDLLGEFRKRIGDGQQSLEPTAAPGSNLCASRPSLSQTALALSLPLLTSPAGSPSRAIAAANLFTSNPCALCANGDCESGGCGMRSCNLVGCSVTCRGGGFPMFACCQSSEGWFSSPRCTCVWCEVEVAPAPVP